MYPLRKPYLKVLILFIVSLSSLNLKSQGIVTDTMFYEIMLNSSDAQRNIDYALIQAAALGNTVGIDWLMRHGANIDTRTYENVSPLMFAVASGEKEAVKELLRYDPEIDFFTASNESPLIVAVKDNDLDMAELLLRDSANVNLQDKKGYSALHFAAIFGYFYMADMLLYYDADVNLKSTEGNTPLIVAVYGGYADITDLFIQNRARVEDSDNEGFTPLMIAAQNGDTLILDILLRNGADIHKVNKYRYDALDLAIKLNEPDAVKFLLSRGKNWSASGNGALNPFSVATIYGRTEIVKILEENNIPESEVKGVDHISLGGSVRACFHDLYLGFSITAREPYKGYGIFGGFDLKPSWSRVIVKESDNSFIQYMDKSYLAYAGALKEIQLTNNFSGGNWLFVCSLAGGVSFGNKYKGTELSPGTKFRVLPAIGFRYNKDTFNFHINLEYVNTDFYRIGPVWLRTGISYNLFLNNFRAPAKIIKW